MSIKVLLVISAIAAGVATDANGKGADADADAAASDYAAVTMTDAEVTPIEKVIIMLEDLQTECITEGKAEAKTYDKFACFCKDMTKEKTDAIKAGQDDVETLSAAIEELNAKREKLDTVISEQEAIIEEVEKAMAEAEKERADTLAVYQANSADMISAMKALDGAINALKSSKPSSLLQMRDVVKTVKRAMLLADALGISAPKSLKAVTSLLQIDQPGVPMEDYSFHSGEIIVMLEGLKGDFKDTKNQLDEEEVASVAAHTMFMQGKTSEKKAAETELDKAKKAKSATEAEIASKSGELTTTRATLLDDQAYLTELAKVCEAQAKTWDQRSQMRAEELGALTEAIAIIKGTVKAKSGKLVRLQQNGVSLGRVLQVASSESDLEAIEEAAEEADEAPSFVQLSSPRLLLSAVQQHGASKALSSQEENEQQDKRIQILALLRTEAKKLNSPLLTQLAVQVAADPFAKLKKLIQELIERLLQEAADEANHKGWCDKEMAKAKQARTHNSDDIVEFNDRLAENEALRDKLQDEILKLETEIAELTAELAKTTKMRSDEKAENAATIKEAEEGLEAVQMAYNVLAKFYKKAGDAKVEFAQQPDLGAPDSGFDSGEAYKGAGGKSGGILGMLEVIISDFKRTIKVTTEEEAKAAQEFIEYERKTKMSIIQKKSSLDSKSKELESTLEALAADKEAMVASQALLDQAIKELLELHEACVDTGMSYAERAALREQEIESLKKALCILDKMGPVQTEGC